ncbi:MAG: hypothetical protein HC790_02070 [Acaryochloridaceae cyanobacterium CSU_3_4]|nr:hypothetical protein [Acaryochloridaceae cyanobacterium CSU_3_4]
MVLARLKSKPSDRSSRTLAHRKQGAAVFMVGVVTVIGLTSLLMGLDWQGYTAQPIAFLGSKAMVAVQGPEPSFVATGYAFPPLLVYGSALMRSPVTLQVFSGALLVGLEIWQMGKLRVARFWQILWTMLILLHPAFGFMLLREPVWVITAVLLWIVLQLMWQLIEPDNDLPISFLIVLMGLTFSGLQLLRFEAWLGLILLLVILWWLLLTETWQYRVAALFLVGTMNLFAIGTCLYLNWLATDDPLAFLYQPGSGLRLPGLDSFWVQAGVGEGILKTMSLIVQIAPIYGLLMVWLLWQTQSHVAVGLLFSLPVALMVITLWQGLYTPNLSQFGVYLALVPLLLAHLPSLQSWRKLLITLGLGISLLCSGWFLQQNQVIPDEIVLWRQLTRQALPELQSVQQFQQQAIEQREIAAYLFQAKQPQQHILLDDGLHFPMMYFLHYTEGLILPHQYEFQVALEHPEERVDFIVITGGRSPLRTQDRVRRLLTQQENLDPESEEALTVQGFNTVLNSPYYQVLQRQTS